MNNNTWYKTAVFCELYIRAYQDSNGDGHGDFRGSIQRLDHIKSLGVTCIWILPINPSPLKDDGYGGLPLIYMGDEMGMLNDPSYLDDPNLANVTEHPQTIQRSRLHQLGFHGILQDQLTQQPITMRSDLALEPYQAVWLTQRR